MNDTTTAALSADERRRKLRETRGDATTAAKDELIIDIEDLGAKDGMPSVIVNNVLAALRHVLDQVQITGYANPANLVSAANNGHSAIAALGSESSNGTGTLVSNDDHDAVRRLRVLAGEMSLTEFVIQLEEMLRGVNTNPDGTVAPKEAVAAKAAAIKGIADGSIPVTADGKPRSELQATNAQRELADFISDLKSKTGTATILGAHGEERHKIVVVDALPDRSKSRLA